MRDESGSTELALGLLRKDPERAARILESHAPELGVQLLQPLDAGEAAAVIGGMLARHAAVFLDRLEEEFSAKVLRDIPAVQAAPILRVLPARRRAALLQRLPSRRAVTLNWLLSHTDDSVGAWTDTRVFTLSAGLSAQEALVQIRNADPAPGETHYVLGKQGRLQGVVTTTRLFRAASTELVAGLCSKPPAPLQAQATLASAASLHGWQLHNALPVLDRNQQFTGVLTREGLEHGLMHETGTDQPGRLADTLMEATQAYWTGLSALWETTFGLLTAPMSLKRGARGEAP